MFAVPHQTWSCKSFWGNQHSSECFACGSLTGPGWAAGLSDAPRTVFLPTDRDSRTHIFSSEHPILVSIKNKSSANWTCRQIYVTFIWFICFRVAQHSPSACSGEEASARYPFCSSLLPAPGFWSEGFVLWKQLGLLPYWPGDVEKNWTM